MEKVLLCIVAASGMLTVSSLAERQYHLVKIMKNWTEAQSYCREKYTDLATVENMEDVNILNNMVSGLGYSSNFYYHYRGWIGLHVGKWKWSLSDEMFYSYGEAEFRNWVNGEPDNFDNKEYCAFMWSNGSWSDFPCESTLPSICSDVKDQNVTFVHINISMTWPEAYSYCRAHHTDLASVRNMSENQKVKELIPPGQRAWIGLYKQFWWSDGSIFSFHYWSALQNVPDETCVAADFAHSGKWTAISCGFKFIFICYSQHTAVQKHVMKIRLDVMEANSNLNMSDPAALEGILKQGYSGKSFLMSQLKQKLDQRRNKDIRLSWSKRSDGKVFHKVKKERKKKRNTNEEL